MVWDSSAQPDYQPSRSSIFGNIPLLLLALFSLLVAKAFATAIYNIYFHPLAKYPGPKYAAASSLVYWIVAFQGNVIPWIRSIHNEYGETVRLGPDRLSYINPEAWKDIYGHRSKDQKPNPQDSRFNHTEKNGHENLISVPEGPEHTRIRRIFSYAFSDKALKQQEPLLLKYVDQLVGNIRRDILKDPDTAFDVVKLYNCTTFDIMAELSFGEPLGLLENSEYTPWVTATFGWVKAGDKMRVLLEYPLLGKLAEALTPKSVKEQAWLHFNHSVERVNRRLEKGTDKPDIWNLVLSQPEGKTLSLGDMHANASLFMIAGSETTATLLSGLTYLLLRHPQKLDNLVTEIRNAVGREEDLNMEGIGNLKYLSACIEEGLRLYPPLPIGPPREIAEGGNVICGDWLPTKTRVSVAQWTAYRSPINFKDPDSFIPERWLPGTGYDGDKKNILQPFSFGPRNCLGMNLGYHEIRLILARLIWNFDFELCSQQESWMDQKVYTFWEKHPLLVKMRLVR